jgi:hypothetical protein
MIYSWWRRDLSARDGVVKVKGVAKEEKRGGRESAPAKHG